mmetsp:Transcript_14971/g.28347  ORF Transcript_14971/g.28347 Transcript_14971/m.28347 type:complete len:212 (-) Transcript_14971:455-1090(-)
MVLVVMVPTPRLNVITTMVTLPARLRNVLPTTQRLWQNRPLIRSTIPENPCRTRRHRRAATKAWLIHLRHHHHRHRTIRITSFTVAEVRGDRSIRLRVLLRTLMISGTTVSHLRIRPTDRTTRRTPQEESTRPSPSLRLRRLILRTRATRILTMKTNTPAWVTITTGNDGKLLPPRRVALHPRRPTKTTTTATHCCPRLPRKLTLKSRILL